VAVLLSRTLGGMRAGDARALDWSHFGPGFAMCSVPRRKTRGKRPPQELDVPEAARPLLAAWHVTCGEPEAGPVLPVQRGARAGERKGDKCSWAAALRRDLLLAGVIRHECKRPADAEPLAPGEACCAALASDPLYAETDSTRPVDFHSTRRAYCTALATANVATSVAQVLAGHSSPEVHQRYVQAASIRALPAGAMLALPAPGVVLASPLPKLESAEAKSRRISGAPGLSRTGDQRFRKPLLYPLSYEGEARVGRAWAQRAAEGALWSRAIAPRAARDKPTLSAAGGLAARHAARAERRQVENVPTPSSAGSPRPSGW
jgi:hypothetical protein